MYWVEHDGPTPKLSFKMWNFSYSSWTTTSNLSRSMCNVMTPFLTEECCSTNLLGHDDRHCIIQYALSKHQHVQGWVHVECVEDCQCRHRVNGWYKRAKGKAEMYSTNTLNATITKYVYAFAGHYFLVVFPWHYYSKSGVHDFVLILVLKSSQYGYCLLYL